MSVVTRILSTIEDGDPREVEQLLPLVGFSLTRTGRAHCRSSDQPKRSCLAIHWITQAIPSIPLFAIA